MLERLKKVYVVTYRTGDGTVVETEHIDICDAYNQMFDIIKEDVERHKDIYSLPIFAALHIALERKNLWAISEWNDTSIGELTLSPDPLQEGKKTSVPFPVGVTKELCQT